MIAFLDKQRDSLIDQYGEEIITMRMAADTDTHDDQGELEF